MRAQVFGLLVFAPFFMTACQETKSPAEQASEDARAIAQVEAAQSAAPPPTPLEAQPITAADLEKAGLYGAGCSLVPAPQRGGDPVLLVDQKRATMKIGGKFVTFAADPGSEELAMGVRTHYVGKAQSLLLDTAPGAGSRLGEEAMRWDGRLAVRDAHGQLIYSNAGEIVCGS